MTRLSQVNSLLPPRCCSGDNSPKYLKVAWILILFVLQNYKEVIGYRHMLSLKFLDNMSRN
jgi:hypothetical protein